MDQVPPPDLRDRIKAIEAALAELTTGMQESVEQSASNKAALAAVQAQVAGLRQDNERLLQQLQQSAAVLPSSEASSEQGRIVRLNVGGEHFATTLATLTQQPNSMLAAMFSGRHTIATDKDGAVFIDRDGQLFHHVLAYLREGQDWEPPSDPALWKRVQREFLYYGFEQATPEEPEEEEQEQVAQEEPQPAPERELEFVYAFGGMGSHGDCEVYSIRADAWYNNWRAPITQVARQAFAAAATLRDHVYVLGGRHLHGQWLDTVERMQYGTRNFREDVAPLTAARGGLAAVGLGPHLYALGGKSTAGFLNLVERYDPTDNTWTVVQGMEERRDGLAAIALRGRIYAIGGKSGGGNAYLNSVEVYDPETNQWAFVAPMLFPRQGHAAVAWNDRIYVMGGFAGGNEFLRSVEIYDPETNTWSEGSPLLYPRMGCAAVALPNRVMVMGGNGMGGRELSETEVLGVGDGRQWQLGAPLGKARSWFPVAVL